MEMDSRNALANINRADFDHLLADYRDVVSSKLIDLDKQRYDDIPAALKGRGTGRGTNVELTKDEVATLVDWKLSHGKFRPTLRKLIQQNTDQDVRRITSTAFRDLHADETSIESSLTTLTQLKGVGPATASLLLAVNKPEEVPFFSDELFRWCFWEDGRGKGWDREIKYSPKEYLTLCAKVGEIRRRCEAEHGTAMYAVDVEKVAYVLGKRAITGAPSNVQQSRKREPAIDPAPDANDEASNPPVKRAKPSKKPSKDLATASTKSQAANTTAAASRSKRQRP